ncbi:MAG: hypothetical protein IPL39_16770 [Opitutaceae bacterium]|nr:hypothetical protein [Opitutaceae bacterium]
MNIRFTLVSEGSSDIALLPILRWALRADARVREVEAQFVRPSELPPARARLAERIRVACALYPADLLFVHRDSDKDPPDVRRCEVRQAIDFVGGDSTPCSDCSRTDDGSVVVD